MHTAFAKIAKLAAMKAKDYHTASDIPMHDSKFNIGQKVKRKYDAKTKNPMVDLVQDVSWNVLKNSWVYGISEHDEHGTYWTDVLEEVLLPL